MRLQFSSALVQKPILTICYSWSVNANIQSVTGATEGIEARRCGQGNYVKCHHGEERKVT